MFGWGGVLRTFTAILSVVTVVWLALWYFIPSPPSTLTIAAALKGGAFDHIASSYRERLARHHVKLDVRFFNDGVAEGLRLLNDPKSGVDAAFLFGGTSSSAQSPNLVSLGRINYAPIWIFYRGAETVDRLTQLKGKRVVVAPAIFTQITRVLSAHGVDANNTTLSSAFGLSSSKELRDGGVDVIFLPPIEMNAPIVQSLLRDPSFRLMSLTQADALTRLFPSLSRLVLPQGVVDLEKNIPATDVNLLATTNVVVVRKDLHPELIVLLAQAISEEHGGAGIFHRAGDFPTQTDPEFPVAEEARDFYKNGPSFLQRYLPFWMINYTKRVAAILVTVIAIIIPIFSFAPRLYAWFLQKYIEKLYRRLRVVETSLQTDLTVNDVEGLQTNLEHISRAAHILPMRHSSLFFDLIMHIRLTRTELESRLAVLRG
jgi:NMT1-like family